MRIRRAILIPLILALGTGSILAGSTISAAAAQAPTAHTQVIASSGPNTWYQG